MVSVQGGLAHSPGCAEDSPLFRSMMPQQIADRPAGAQGPEDEAAPPEPAMRQALHLCVVERFDPLKPFGGARRALHRT
ncbi:MULTISPECIES: hypothetical protein [Acetobacterales]|uniref:hypothetical protein n=1 Tax=Roseomonas sp. WGS1072 TaxID=3366816 RepID=UPI003BF2EACE